MQHEKFIKESGKEFCQTKELTFVELARRSAKAGWEQELTATAISGIHSLRTMK